MLWRCISYRCILKVSPFTAQRMHALEGLVFRKRAASSLAAAPGLLAHASVTERVKSSPIGMKTQVSRYIHVFAFAVQIEGTFNPDMVEFVSSSLNIPKNMVSARNVKHVRTSELALCMLFPLYAPSCA